MLLDIYLFQMTSEHNIEMKAYQLLNQNWKVAVN